MRSLFTLKMSECPNLKSNITAKLQCHIDVTCNTFFSPKIQIFNRLPLVSILKEVFFIRIMLIRIYINAQVLTENLFLRL